MTSLMQAIICDQGQLRLVQRPIPQPCAGEVRIRIAYAGVNRADLLQTQGLYPPPEGASDILGLEVSGHIDALGDNIHQWQTGDAVCALVSSGAYADYVTLPAAHCMRIPAPLTLAESAGIMECALTVWMSLFDEARLKSGEAVLVHGGSSGIGTTAIQMLRAYGCPVFATASTATKCALIEQLGATAINYKTDDFVAPIKASGGVDVVLDMVGGDYIMRNMQCLRAGGRLMSIACLQSTQVNLGMGGLLMKGLSWKGSTLRRRCDTDKAQLIAAMQPHLQHWIATGAFKPVIDRIFPLQQADKALETMQQGLHCGKILLQVGSAQAS